MPGLLLLKRALFLIELPFEGFAPALLLLHFRQLLLVEGNLRGGLVDRTRA
ncbi:hypothetical protein D3C84_1015110 [compost metagenome]